MVQRRSRMAGKLKGDLATEMGESVVNNFGALDSRRGIVANWSIHETEGKEREEEENKSECRSCSSGCVHFRCGDSVACGSAVFATPRNARDAECTPRRADATPTRVMSAFGQIGWVLPPSLLTDPTVRNYRSGFVRHDSRSSPGVRDAWAQHGRRLPRVRRASHRRQIRPTVWTNSPTSRTRPRRCVSSSSTAINSSQWKIRSLKTTRS